jgi:murein DD-endopeptidase MepM/ murein hydrolase activator NlpD
MGIARLFRVARTIPASLGDFYLRQTVAPKFGLIGVAVLAFGVLAAVSAVAQAAYKYRDSSGHWVYTDRPPPDGVTSDAFNVAPKEAKLDLEVTRRDDDESTKLVAINGCLCVVTVEVAILRSQIASLGAGAQLRDSLAPQSEKVLALAPGAANKSKELIFQWKAALGSPYATHAPPGPYRIPFGVGSSYLVTQAFPVRITHVTADSAYAVDFALPDGTPVYAAREGVVINARHDAFKGAIDPVLLDQANVVEILHDDGSIAVYAHLHWDSIRVRIGQHVKRGEYIANSGNTGFSSGPHLHFAVLVNSGFEDVSVPVLFAGSGGDTVVPVTHTKLTAY